MSQRNAIVVLSSLLALLFALFASGAGAAPGSIRWDSRLESAVATDEAVEGNRVFVSGSIADATGNGDWLVRSLDAATGTLVWQDRFDLSGGFDSAQAIDVRGGVVVASGFMGAAPRNRDAFVRAYEAGGGTLLWQDRFDAAGRLDEFSFHTISIGRDAVFVGGLKSPVDWFVRAYDLTSGALLWQDVFNGGSFDHTVALAAQGSRVFAGGVTTDSSFRRHFTVRAYDARSGGLLWHDQVSVGSFGFFFGAGVAWELAAHGDTLVAAGSISDDPGSLWAVRAYDAATGGLRWSHLDHSGPSAADVAFSLAVGAGGVFVTGAGGAGCSGIVVSDCDVLVRAYDRETGASLWRVQFDEAGGDDQGNVVRTAGSVVLVGSVVTSASGAADWLAQSYDAATGALAWSDRVSAPGGFAFPNQIAVSGSRAFVTGFQFDASGVQDALVRAYDIH